MFQPLLAASRPRFWLYLFGPALVGLAASGTPVAFLHDWRVVLFLLAWTLPANLFLYGVNDLADEDTDAANPKKSGYEHRLKESEKYLLTIGACAGMVIVGVAALLTFDFATMSWTAAFLILGVCYSLPPQRFKARPFIDSASNILYVLPGFAMASALGAAPSVVVIAAAWAWAAAMHLFSALPDITPDREAGLHTTAVTLGRQDSLLLCFILWLFAAVVALQLGFTLAGLLALAYPALAIMLLDQPERPVITVYYWMPYLNAIVGFVLFWSVLL